MSWQQANKINEYYSKMDKPTLFNQLHSLKLDKEELKNAVTLKLSDSDRQYLEKFSLKFPYPFFQKILRQRKLKPLEEKLYNVWKSHLPKEIHKDCLFDLNTESLDKDRNCYQFLLEFQILYMISGNQFAQLIQNNNTVLRNIIKEKLAILFFEKAFVFERGQSFFQVGEMCRLLLKEGLIDISSQLKQLETKTALEISNTNLTQIRKESILNESGFKDVEEFQKEFWEIEKDNFQTKLQIEESKMPSFIDYFIKGIKELQNQGNNQECIRNINNELFHEAPFRNYFKALLSQNFDSVEAEPEKCNGRIDLKIQDKKLNSSIIIEFKGWWNRDKYNVTEQTLSYLTDFERDGYIFIINHLKSKNIINDYQKKIISPKTNFVKGTWKELKYKSTDFSYFISEHEVEGKIKILYHFIFNTNKV